MQRQHWIRAVGSYLAVFALGVASTLAQSTVRVDVDANGVLWGAGERVVISGDGRWIFFESGLPAAAEDTNELGDVVARDRLTGAVELVSVATSGAIGDYPSRMICASADGRFVLFATVASTFSSPPPTTPQVFVRDRSTRTTTLASCNGSGLPLDGWMWDADMSDDGNLVVFSTESQNLGVLDPNGTGEDVFLRDIAAGTTTLISASAPGITGNQGSHEPCISADGRWIAYVTHAVDIVGPTTPLYGSLVVHDRANGSNTRIDAPGGALFDLGAERPSLSSDGRVLAFASGSSNITPGLTDGGTDIFAFDRVNGVFRLLSPGWNGTPSDDMSSYPEISRDGARVIFTSRATNLVSNDTNGAWDAFVADVASGAVTRVSVSSTGYEGDTAWASWQGVSSPLSISDDGRFTTFVTDIKSLVAGDIDDGYDGFLRDEQSPCAPVTVYCTAKPNSVGCGPQILSAGDPYATGPDAFYLCALSVLPNRNGAFLWGLAPTALPFGGGTLCVAAPRVRTRVQDSDESTNVPYCSGRYGFHFSQDYQSAHAVGAGATIFGQFWSRDPGFASPDNIGLTDGIRFTLGP